MKIVILLTVMLIPATAVSAEKPRRDAIAATSKTPARVSRINCLAEEVLEKLANGPVPTRPWDDAEYAEDEIEFLIDSLLVEEYRGQYHLTDLGREEIRSIISARWKAAYDREQLRLAKRIKKQKGHGHE